MAQLATKRIMMDIKNFNNSGLNDQGIFIKYSDDNIYQMNALIFGPKDTPYANGNYLFGIQFPKNYPMKPPIVRFETYGKNIRFNPNLYVNGKVCLSILGTWAGPGWTSCCTLSTILLSIQTLLHEYPIQNEPGWEKCTDVKADRYNIIVEYGNVCVSVIDLIEKPARSYMFFKDIMINNLIKNKEYFIQYFEKNKNKEGIVFQSSIHTREFKPEYEYYYSKLVNLLSNHIKQVEPIETQEYKVEINVVVAQPKKNTRKVPKELAKSFEEGEIKEGLDGNQYIVKTTIKGNKRWNKCK
jgi:ubiquitin-conjugating enzyme E2 Z